MCMYVNVSVLYISVCQCAVTMRVCVCVCVCVCVSVHVCAHLLGQVSIENNYACVEDKQKRFHLERLSVLHVTRGNTDKQEVECCHDDGWEW